MPITKDAGRGVGLAARLPFPVDCEWLAGLVGFVLPPRSFGNPGEGRGLFSTDQRNMSFSEGHLLGWWFLFFKWGDGAFLSLRRISRTAPRRREPPLPLSRPTPLAPPIPAQGPPASPPRCSSLPPAHSAPTTTILARGRR